MVHGVYNIVRYLGTAHENARNEYPVRIIESNRNTKTGPEYSRASVIVDTGNTASVTRPIGTYMIFASGSVS